jgi:hypothetical protein
MSGKSKTPQGGCYCYAPAQREDANGVLQDEPLLGHRFPDGMHQGVSWTDGEQKGFGPVGCAGNCAGEPDDAYTQLDGEGNTYVL